MDVCICKHKAETGAAAAEYGAVAIKQAITAKGSANIILATGASQFEMLHSLVARSDVDWSKVTAFHLDEYIGLPMGHPASFKKYLQERFVAKVSALQAFYFVDGNRANPEEECQRLNAIIQAYPIDVAFVGIGENGHLAFNDPPADFITESPFIIVELDEACRRQQLGEGWFTALDEIPKRAISMSIRQILKSRRLVVTVPDESKAKAVKCVVEGEVSNLCPASILQIHSDCALFLEPASASLLQKKDPS
jgi:glucosamine-6-phosphate deaminase